MLNENKITIMIMSFLFMSGWLFGSYISYNWDTLTIYYTDTIPTKTGAILTKQPDKQPIRQKRNIIEKDRILQAKNKEQSKPIYRNSSRIKQQHLETLWIQSELASTIIDTCNSTARDPDHCIKSTIGTSTSESSLFKHCYQNNCFWLLNKGKVISYTSIQENIKDWIYRYNKYRYNNHTWRDWLIRSRYCQSECKTWAYNFDSAVSKL